MDLPPPPATGTSAAAGAPPTAPSSRTVPKTIDEVSVLLATQGVDAMSQTLQFIMSARRFVWLSTEVSLRFHHVSQAGLTMCGTGVSYDICMASLTGVTDLLLGLSYLAMLKQTTGEGESDQGGPAGEPPGRGTHRDTNHAWSDPEPAFLGA